MTTLRYGLALPLESDVISFAREAERIGFDLITSAEHVAFHVPVPNSFAWLAAAAGATTDIDLVSTVSLPALYPAPLFAKMVASLDFLSKGRFSVGVGVGGEYEAEFQACGVPVNERGARTDEALEILVQLLNAAGPSSYEGRFAQFEDITIGPRQSSSCPPIWVGGRQKAAMRRAARFADVWMPYMFSPEQVVDGRSVIADLAPNFGRESSDVETALYSFAVVSDDREDALQQALSFAERRYRQDFTALSHKFLVGTPDDVAARMRDYVDVGVSTFVLELACSADRYDDQMRRLSTEVFPIVEGVPAA